MKSTFIFYNFCFEYILQLIHTQELWLRHDVIMRSVLGSV